MIKGGVLMSPGITDHQSWALVSQGKDGVRGSVIFHPLSVFLATCHQSPVSPVAFTP